MKIKSNLLLAVFFVLSIGLFNINVLAQFKCDEAIYYGYSGIYSNLDEAEDEFKMLMESPKHANFREMFKALRYIVSCSEENKECAKALKNPDSDIHKYTEKLVNFYEANAINIKDELVKQLFESFKKGEGKIFFKKENGYN